MCPLATKSSRITTEFFFRLLTFVSAHKYWNQNAIFNGHLLRVWGDTWQFSHTNIYLCSFYQETSLRQSESHENLSEFRIGGGADDDCVAEGSFKVIDGTNTPHGVFRKINEFGDVEFFGLFYEGNLVARCWKSLPGGKRCILKRSLQYIKNGRGLKAETTHSVRTFKHKQKSQVFSLFCEKQQWIGLNFPGSHVK